MTPTPSQPSLTDTLCTACGLCCDGTLLADVELGGKDDLVALELMGLEIEDPDEEHDGLLLLPCGALRGTRCSIYAHRPECCRTFECRLLQEAARGIVTVEQAMVTINDAVARVARVRSLVDTLDPGQDRMSLKERALEALANSEADSVDAGVRRTRGLLESEMQTLEDILHKRFLHGSR